MSATARDVTFFHISDQHYNIDEEASPAEQKAETKAEKIFPQTINAMNDLPGTPYPDRIGGQVDEPRGVVMTGDLANDGNPDEFARWNAQWGFTGEEGLLNYPVYEGVGNHDGPPSSATEGQRGAVRREIIKRNQKRPGLANVSANGLHYSWDWDDVHFVQLNEYTGPEDDKRYSGNVSYGRKRQSYGNPAEKSLQFLRKDLASQVGDSKRPIILLQHYGFGVFPLNAWGGAAAWWTEEQALRLWEAIEGYNVIGILSGHDGSEAVLRWNGIYNRHMDDVDRFGVYHLTDDKMTVAHRNAKSNRWENLYEQSSRIDASLPPELAQGPYLVYAGNPGTMTVLWRTKTNVICKLKWGDDRFEYEDGNVEVKPCADKLNLYKYTIKDLKPNGAIKYALEINGKFAPGMFYAAPEGADKVKFLIAGEQQNADRRNTLYEKIYDKIYEDAAYHSIILRPGNMVSEPDSLRSWDSEFFSRKKDARHVRWIQSRMPMAVVPGDSSAKRHFFPSGANDFGAYSFEYGPVRFTVLNAEKGLDRGSRQSEWLQDKHRNTTAKWSVVIWNPPADKTSATQFLENFHSISAAWDVDLCILGGADYNLRKRNTTTYLTPGALSAAVQAEGETLTWEMF